MKIYISDVTLASFAMQLSGKLLVTVLHSTDLANVTKVPSKHPGWHKLQKAAKRLWRIFLICEDFGGLKVRK